MNVQTDIRQPRGKHQLFNARVRAKQFQAWQIAKDNNGNVTRDQIADQIGVDRAHMKRLLRDEKWAQTLRATRLDLTDSPPHHAGHVAEAHDLARGLGFGFGRDGDDD